MRLMGLDGAGDCTHWQAQINHTLRDSFYVPSDSLGIAIDVGAHVGMNTIEFSDMYNEVYAFEPVREIYDCLTETVRLNVKDTQRIHCFNTALGHTQGDVEICYNPENTLATSKKGQNSRMSSTQVPMTTLDLTIPDDKPVSLIKLDCEGVELDVLRGAENIIERNSPTIVFEWKPKISRKWTNGDTEIFTYLTSMGYRIANKFAREIDPRTISKNRVDVLPMMPGLRREQSPTYCDFFATRHKRYTYEAGRYAWR